MKLLILFFFSPFAPLTATVYSHKPEEFKPKVEVVGCFLQNGDEILLLHRQNGKMYGNLWAIPGGKIDPDETVFDAAIREVSEETSFDISKQPIKYLKKVYIKTRNIDFVYHMVQCNVPCASSAVKLHPEEHKGFTWVMPQDALKMPLMEDEDTCIKMICDL